VEKLESLISSSAGSEGDGGDAKLITRVCALLDPEGPLKYKGLTVMPDGMGYALAAAVEDDNKEMIGLVTELVQKGIAGDWFEQKISAGRSDLTLEAKTFKLLQQFVRHSGPGYGVERVLYELNQFLPCRSPVLASAYVYSLREFLPAIDSVVAEKGSLSKLVDRHIAAFIASRLKGSLDSQLAALEHTTGASVSSKIGMTGLLAKVQNEYQHQMTPNLTAWLVEELQPAISRYNSKSLRKRISDKMDEVAASGNLMELFHTLSNKNIVTKDERAQSRAKREYGEAAREVKRLESEEFQVEAKRTGWRIAAGISLVIGMVTTIGVFSW
jgi:eukaryotic-like serine/threonine-protein kinase